MHCQNILFNLYRYDIALNFFFMLKYACFTLDEMSKGSNLSPEIGISTYFEFTLIKTIIKENMTLKIFEKNKYVPVHRRCK